ncbi:MAG: hypothetical protein BMS9Abin06_1164 [Gammaproteobacteria bacterium]|nr:MAG: hypothetical protein BMS9Abin06_1164 [Gammaproteobacteria bacterium]
MMKSRLAGVVCACILTLSTLTANAAGIITLPNGFDLYNTGIDVVTGVDQRYLVDGGTAFLNSESYLSPNNTDSAWLGPNATGGATINITYDLTTGIDLSGIDVSIFSLSGFWISDNEGVDILVNGSSTGQTNTGFHSDLPDAFADNAFSLSGADGLIAGLNTITFRWGNGPNFGGSIVSPDPTHVRVQFSGFSVVPIPAAGWLFGSGLLGLIGVARHKKA